MALFRVRRAERGRSDMFSGQEMEIPQVKPEDTRQVPNGTGVHSEDIATKGTASATANQILIHAEATNRDDCCTGQPGEEPKAEACAATPTFAKAAVFANAVAEDGGVGVWAPKNSAKNCWRGRWSGSAPDTCMWIPRDVSLAASPRLQKPQLVYRASIFNKSLHVSRDAIFKILGGARLIAREQPFRASVKPCFA